MKKLFAPVVLSLGLFVPSLAWAQKVDTLAPLPDAPLPRNSELAVQQRPAATTQDSAADATAGSTQQPSSSSHPAQAPSPDEVKNEEKQRMLGIMPAFNSVQSGQAAPLTKGQKFDLWYHSAIDPFTFAVAGIDAGLEQAENQYPEYRQGFVGFAKRYGAGYTDNVDGNLWGNAILPVLLRQDPRYFRLGHGTVKKRLLYAVESTVRCKGDNGKWQPSYSNVGGNLIGGAISNAYYPASDRGIGLSLERGFTVTAEGVFGALAFEFYPDFAGYLQRRHERKTNPAVPPSAATTPITPAPQL